MEQEGGHRPRKPRRQKSTTKHSRTPHCRSPVDSSRTCARLSNGSIC